MARMTPPVIGVNTPGGERMVYEKIHQTLPDEVNALHSLEIRDHYIKNKLKGETDFCIIYPEHGIFIIEVKGGQWEVKNGQWYPQKFGNTSTVPLHETPFHQAENNYYSIKNKIESNFKEFKKQNILITWGVVFPNASFPSELFELDGENWRVWDASNFGDSFDHYLKLLSTKEKQRLEKAGRRVTLPSEEMCKLVKNYLRPDYECPKLIKAEVDAADEKINRYTLDQFDVLDQMLDNERVVVMGGAGTGKTLIATEAIRRNVQAHKRTLFLCKNKEITDTVRSILRSEGYFDLFYNTPRVYTWDKYLELRTRYADKLDDLKRFKYKDNIGEYFKVLPKIALKRDRFFLSKIKDNASKLSDQTISVFANFDFDISRLSNINTFKSVQNKSKNLEVYKAVIDVNGIIQREEFKSNYNLFFDSLTKKKTLFSNLDTEDFEIEYNSNRFTFFSEMDGVFLCVFKNKNLQDIYDNHLFTLSFIKGFSENEKNREAEEYLQFFSNKSYLHRVYFFDKDLNRPESMIFDKEKTISSDPIFSLYRNLSLYNGEVNFKKFYIRVENEIQFFKAKHNKDFFYNGRACDLYKQNHSFHSNDVIIVDESQDIVKKTDFSPGGNQTNLNLLHFSVKHGLYKGNWNFYLDPMQFTSKFGVEGGINSFKQVKSILDNTNPTYTRLTTNCRNTKEISKAMFELCEVNESIKELNFSYKINKNVETGLKPTFHYYDDAKEIPEIINKICKPLHHEEVKGKDIQILSMESSVQKYIYNANKYFDIYRSTGFGYQSLNTGQDFSLRHDYNYTGNYLLLNFFKRNVFPDSVLKNLSIPNFSEKFKSCINAEDNKISFHYPRINYSKSTDKSFYYYLFYKYLSKEDSKLLINRLKDFDEKMPFFKDLRKEIQSDTEFEQFMNSDLVKYFSLPNFKAVSFFEKFYSKDINGNLTLDYDEIESFTNLENWYKEFSNISLFLYDEIMYNSDESSLSPLCQPWGDASGMFSINHGCSKIEPAYSLEWHEWEKVKNIDGNTLEQYGNKGFDPNFSLEDFKNSFVKFCEDFKDFENKSAKTCSVGQFRGMDQKYVILVGLREITQKTLQSLYIGMSRAKVKLDIITHRSLESGIREKLYGK